MNYLTNSQMIASSTKQTGKYAVYVNGMVCNLYGIPEKAKKITGGDVDVIATQIINGGLFLFDSDDKALEFFSLFNNSEMIKDGVYTAIYYPNYGLMDENT